MKRHPILTLSLAIVVFVCSLNAPAAPFNSLLTADDIPSLKAGRVGVAYEFQFQTEGGLAPLKWRVVDGQLPPGLELLPSGILRGTPGVARQEPYIFDVEVSDSSSPAQTYSQRIMLLINGAPLRIVTHTQPLKIVTSNQPVVQVAGERVVNDATATSVARNAPAATQGGGNGSGNAQGSSTPQPAVTPAQVAASGLTSAAGIFSEANQEYIWGRVRAYFAGYGIFSKENGDFSKQDIGLGFTLDKNYLTSGRFNINTYFDVRLTSIPVITKDTPTTTPPATSTETPTFLTSKKAALMQVGVYLPVGVTVWDFQNERNELFLAPLVKGGIQTVTSDTTTREALRLGADDVFNFYSFGIRFGHVRRDNPFKFKTNPCPVGSAANPNLDNTDAQPVTDSRGSRQGVDCNKPYLPAWSPNHAPELLSYLDITRGRFENFELSSTITTNAGMAQIIQRPYRIATEGRLKIPATPMIIGFDGNFGKGRDDLRFLFGLKFDIGKLFGNLKILEKLQLKAEEAKKAADAAKQ